MRTGVDDGEGALATTTGDRNDRTGGTRSRACGQCVIRTRSLRTKKKEKRCSLLLCGIGDVSGV